jgi:PilZ domain
MFPKTSQERRRSRRIRIGQPLRVRPSDPKDAPFEETSTTKNVSREGIFFHTALKSYYEGMRLFVNVPYHSPRAPSDQEYIGQVARIEQLPRGESGIAVQLLTSLGAKPDPGSAGAKLK